MLEFTREKVTGLDNRTYTRFIEKDSTESRPFRIVASSSGVHMEGKMSKEIEDMASLQAFAKQMSDVWVEHTKLRNALIGSISRPS